MATAAAERLLRRKLVEGCEQNVYLTSPGAGAALTIAFGGGHAHLPDRHVVGGHVEAFVLHGCHDAGVFDCL